MSVWGREGRKRGGCRCSWTQVHGLGAGVLAYIDA